MLRVALDRFESTVREYETYPVTKGKVLLYGSSFFTNWGHERAAKQLAAVGVENHGIGGGTVDELLYYYGRLVKPYEPRAMVLRAGANDLGRGYSAEETMDMTERLCAWMRKDFPGIRFILMPVFDYRSMAGKKKYCDGVRAYNAMLKVYCDKNADADYFDISPILYKNPASVGTLEGFRDIFREDGLHLTDAGYEWFAPWFAERLLEFLK